MPVLFLPYTPWDMGNMAGSRRQRDCADGAQRERERERRSEGSEMNEKGLFKENESLRGGVRPERYCLRIFRSPQIMLWQRLNNGHARGGGEERCGREWRR